MLASGVVEALEHKLTDLLDHIELQDAVQYYIGSEHLLADMQSCSVLVKRYEMRGEEGAIGIIGPMRMDYAYNTVALEMVSDLLKNS